MKLTQKELKRLLVYDPDTGIFTNKVSRKKTRAGEECQSFDSKGYLRVEIQTKKYLLHRLAFLYMEGYLPEHYVDHKNGIRDDNRWCNLRHVNQSCNMQNQKCSIANSSGFSGVNWNSKSNKWAARGCINGKRISLGYYTSPLEAALARFTWEAQCSKWHCSCRGVLIKQIQAVWPKFNLLFMEVS